LTITISVIITVLNVIRQLCGPEWYTRNIVRGRELCLRLIKL
jgi:hypothetical protein